METSKIALYILGTCLFIVAIYLLVVNFLPKPSKFLTRRIEKYSTCNPSSCGAIDPVSEPSYNIKNLIKQTILLEEHLAEENKYCIDCIIKHFLHCQGLIEEAIWLACEDVDTYPYLKESDKIYKDNFEVWLANKHNDEIRLQILSALRDIRKKLVASYYSNDE